MTRLPFILADLEAAIDGHLPKPRLQQIEVTMEPDAFFAIKQAMLDHYGEPYTDGCLIGENFIRIGQSMILMREKLDAS